jgi:hypothetical protein
VPRRTRGHIYRKQAAPPASDPSRANGASTTIEPAAEGDTVTVATELEAAAVDASAHYVRRQTFTSARATPAVQTAPRSSRAVATDYGYVVSELKRIGITFGGLVILLLVVSRLLR